VRGITGSSGFHKTRPATAFPFPEWIATDPFCGEWSSITEQTDDSFPFFLEYGDCLRILIQVIAVPEAWLSPSFRCYINPACPSYSNDPCGRDFKADDFEAFPSKNRHSTRPVPNQTEEPSPRGLNKDGKHVKILPTVRQGGFSRGWPAKSTR